MGSKAKTRRFRESQSAAGDDGGRTGICREPGRGGQTVGEAVVERCGEQAARQAGLLRIKKKWKFLIHLPGEGMRRSTLCV